MQDQTAADPRAARPKLLEEKTAGQKIVVKADPFCTGPVEVIPQAAHQPAAHRFVGQGRTEVVRLDKFQSGARFIFKGERLPLFFPGIRRTAGSKFRQIVTGQANCLFPPR